MATRVTPLSHLAPDTASLGTPEPRRAIRVMVVDAHELIRRGIRHLIAEHPDLRMAGEAGTSRDALQMVGGSRADVAIVDLSLPGGSGIELCRVLGEQDVRCLVLTSFIDEEAIMGALAAGADGFLPKDAGGHELAAAIRAIASGAAPLDATATRALVRHFRERRRDQRYGSLTSQERLVLALLAEGLTNRQIADRTRLAEKTVRNYVSKVLAKLGLRHRTEAALYAVR
ncbi:MAG: response regulator, partial [Actinomycetota bacterium]